MSFTLMNRRVRLVLFATCVAVVVVTFSDTLLVIDANLIRALRGAPGGKYIDPALIVTALGSTPVALGLATIGVLGLLAARQWFEALFLLLSVVGATQVNPALKDLFSRPRPLPSDPSLTFSGSGFPSGHAMTATVVYGALLMIYISNESRRDRRAVAIGATATLVATVAATRIYLGAHYLTDVIGGIACGVMWLMISDAAVQSLLRIAHARSLMQRRPISSPKK
jgi:undecaprenyl-diphosphatase